MFCKTILVLLAFTIMSCASNKLLINSTEPAIEPARNETPVFTIYAVGDAGEDNDQSRAVLDRLAFLALDDHQPGMILFLGDNIYPKGLAPPSETKAFEESKALLKWQTELLLSYNGQIIYIPGNHDWNEFKPGGLEAIKRQAEYLKSFQNANIRLLPENGCAGPVALNLNDDVLMLIVDSQWWIQDWEKELSMNEGCEIQSREELGAAVHQLIEENQHKQIVIAMHHPLFCQGPHGGHFGVRDHLFPLTKLVNWLWIPLPVIGSIYPAYRSWIGHPQDLKNPRYQSLKESILEDLNYNGELIFLAGHDHSLQYITSQDNHFLVSGAGAKHNPVANDKDLIYGHGAAGFMELNFFTNKSVELSVYEVDKDSNSHQIVFRQTLVESINQ